MQIIQNLINTIMTTFTTKTNRFSNIMTGTHVYVIADYWDAEDCHVVPATVTAKKHGKIVTTTTDGESETYDVNQPLLFETKAEAKAAMSWWQAMA